MTVGAQFYCLELLFLSRHCRGPSLISLLAAGIRLAGFQGHFVATGPSGIGLLGPSGFCGLRLISGEAVTQFPGPLLSTPGPLAGWASVWCLGVW